MKKIVIPLMLIFFIGLAFSPIQKDKNKVIWKEGTQLKWSDFQGAPNIESGLNAYTSAGIKCKPTKTKYKRGEIVDYEVYAYFDKTKSWVIPEMKSEYYLKHEQIHFDIAEVYARKLNQYLIEAKIPIEEADRVNEYLDEVIMQLRAAQIQYDKETQRGEDKIAQYNWAKYILEELGKLDKLL